MEKREDSRKKRANKAVSGNDPSNFLLDDLKASGVYSEYLEACEAKRKRSTNGNQLHLNHGTSNLPRRLEPLELTSAERLRTREFEWITITSGTKMKAAQGPPTKQIRAYDVEQPQSAKTELSPAVKAAKKKRVQ